MQQRERAVVQFHHHAGDGFLHFRIGDLEQLQDDGLIRTEHRAAGDPEQNAVADLAGRSGHCDAHGGLTHVGDPPEEKKSRVKFGPQASRPVRRYYIVMNVETSPGKVAALRAALAGIVGDAHVLTAARGRDRLRLRRDVFRQYAAARGPAGLDRRGGGDPPLRQRANASRSRRARWAAASPAARSRLHGSIVLGVARLEPDPGRSTRSTGSPSRKPA